MFVARLIIVTLSLIIVFQDIQGAANQPTSQVRLTVYTGSTANLAVKTSFAGDKIENILTVLNYKKPTVLYIHGHREIPSNESVITIANAYLKRGDHNFVLLDWSERAKGSYFPTLPIVKEVARYIAQVLNNLSGKGFPSNTLHIVGHSLGGQLAGFIGKSTSFKVTRISALDPAFPGYYQLNAEHISASSAKFVDVIHTDGGVFGALSPTGTVDCYPNGGIRFQPGCPVLFIPQSPNDYCSHWRSWRFWAESLLSESAFLAVKCDSYFSFQSGKCQKSETAYCGFKMSNTKSGKFYLTTNARSPFGKNSNGINPK